MTMRILIDFDGVLHSYTSGWQGYDVIPDPPVEGAMEWFISLMKDGRFEPVVFSSRASHDPGKHYIYKWLRDYGMTQELIYTYGLPKVTHEKLPAHICIDDRGVQFQGMFPSLESLAAFQPWKVGMMPRGPVLL